MASNLNAIVAQLNSSKPTASTEPKKEKKPPKPKAPGAANKSKPKGGADASKASNLSSKIGQVASGAAAVVAQPSVTAQTLTASAMYSVPPPDPSTAPLLKRLKDVLDALLARNGSQLTPAELHEATRLNLGRDSALLREVHRHERITWPGAPATAEAKAAAPAPTAPAAWYSYFPEIPGIRDKVGLLNYVRDRGPAVQADQLRRCYLRAKEDLEELKKEGRVFVVGHTDPEKETVFVRDMMGQEGVQDNVRGLWFEVCQEHIKDHVPQDVYELQKAVVKAGLRSALANQPIKRVLGQAGPKERQKKPRQQRININKATNAHLPFLFQGAQPTALDS